MDKKYYFLTNPDLPHCVVQRTTNQSIPNVTWTTLAYNQLVTQLDMLWDFTNNRIQITENGIYEISAPTVFAASGVGGRWNRLSVNGVFPYFNVNLPNSVVVGGFNAGNTVWMNVTTPLFSGDLVLLQVAHNVGAAHNVIPSGSMPLFSIVKLSDV